MKNSMLTNRSAGVSSPAMTVLIMIFAIALIGGAFWLMRNAGQNDLATGNTVNDPLGPDQTPQEGVFPPTQPPTQPTTPPRIFSETYTGQVMNFSIQHPEEVEVRETQDGYVSLTRIGPTQAEDTEFFDGISILIRRLPREGRSLLEIAEQDIENMPPGIGTVIVEPTPVTINGMDGYVYTAETLGRYDKYFVTEAGSSDYLEITDSTVDPTDQGFEETAEQMLSTLTMIN